MKINFQEDSRSILYVSVVGSLLILIGGAVAATQYVASALAYQEGLGAPWFVLGTVPIYYPWRFLQWMYYYNFYAPDIFQRALYIIMGVGVLQILMLVGTAIWRAKRQSAGDAYGTARWAKDKELKRLKFFAGEGVVLGQTPKGQLIQDESGKHILAFAPTQSGKGVGLVIPTLFSWKGSVIVFDMKRENWEITAGFRQRFSHVWLFEPTSSLSAHYNPLLEIRQGPKEFEDTQNVAEMLVVPEESAAKKDFWERVGKSLLIGTILHVLYAEDDKSLPGVVTFLANPKRSLAETLKYMRDFSHLPTGPHPIIASLAQEVMNKSPNELSGVLSTALSFLTIYRDPVIAENIRTSDFSIQDLMHQKSPVSLYLSIPASNIERTTPLFRLILNQITRRLTEGMANPTQAPAYRHRLLLLLDEFPVLGHLSFLEKGLAFFAGYGLRAMLIAQSLNQLEKIYGPNHAILDNAHLRVTYGSLDERTAERISKLLGQATQVRKQANYAGSRFAPFLTHTMVSEQESPRPLLTPGEILNLPAEDSLLLIGGHHPYYAKKVFYYKDRRFQERASLPRPETRETMVREFPARPPSAWEQLPSRTESDSPPSPAPSFSPDAEEKPDQQNLVIVPLGRQGDLARTRSLSDLGRDSGQSERTTEDGASDEEAARHEQQRLLAQRRGMTKVRNMDLWQEPGMDGPDL